MWPLLATLVRLDRRLARRGRARDEARRRARARDRRRRGRLRGRRGAQRPGRHAARSSPSSPAATSISRKFASLVGACRSSHRHHHEPLLDPSSPSRTHRAVSTSSPSISGGAGTPTRASVFRRLDYPLWRATAHNPVRMLRLISREQARRGGARPGVPARSTTARSRRSTRRARRDNTWWASTVPAARRAVDRVLLGRVRAAPVAADLRRRPRRAGRRSLQGSQRPRRAAHRRRLHVSAGLLPPAHLGRRLAGRELRAAQLGRRADRAGARRRTASRASPRCRSAIARARRGLARAARPRARCTCSTPTSRRTRRGIASCRRASTAATARRASSRRSSSASAASAR